MIIKKHRNKNRYILADNIYVRDFTNHDITPVDVNRHLGLLDQNLIIDNELENYSHRYQNIDSEDIFHDKIIIVSDGYQFEEKHKFLAHISKDVAILAVNGALKKWTMVGNNAKLKRNINYYVVNNPYSDCISYLPDRHRYYPKCIASIRTNPKFLAGYNNSAKYIYYPVKNEFYSGVAASAGYRIDDYRNPICAALGLAYRFHARKILLFCCDDAFDCEKPSSIKLENGLWQYPQQAMCQRIIDANCHWLKTQKIEVADYSSGGNYEHISYIRSEEGILEYFKDE